MRFEVSSNNDITIITAHTKRIDAAVAPELRELIGSLVEQGKIRIVLDISMVNFMDSSG